MRKYKIWPIPLAQMTSDQSMSTYRMGFGETSTKVVYVWYLEAPGQKILVDAGVSAEYLAKKRGIPAKEIGNLDQGLQKHGLTKSDIDLIILTHLHNDHVAQAREFPKAKFLVQKKELEFAKNPHPTVAKQYAQDFFDGLDFEVLQGDQPVCDGIRVLETPGHTPGGQSVVIDAARGSAVISGICSQKVNFEPPAPSNQTMEVFPCGIFVNLFDLYDNLLKIKRAADIVIPNHDTAYLDGKAIG